MLLKINSQKVLLHTAEHIETHQHIVLLFDNHHGLYFYVLQDHLHCKNPDLSSDHINRKKPGPRHYQDMTVSHPILHEQDIYQGNCSTKNLQNDNL